MARILPYRGESSRGLRSLLGQSLSGGIGFDRLVADIRLRRQFVHAAGVPAIAKVIADRVLNSSPRVFVQVSKLFTGRRVIEVGGPTRALHSLIPVYRESKTVDEIEWHSDLFWPNRGETTTSFAWGGQSIVADATDLAPVPDASYDGLVASHVLEHIANPVRAIREWARVLQGNAPALIVVPQRDFGFDHNRPLTTFEHIWQDYCRNVAEDDQTHVAETLSRHDLMMDSAALPIEAFTYRVTHNENYRVIHHHVFDERTLGMTLRAGGMTPVKMLSYPTLGLICVAAADS